MAESLRTDLEKTHESVFDLDWLKRHSYSPKPTSNLDNSFNSQKLVKLWDKDVYEKEKYEVDYNDITSNNPAGLSKTLDMIKKFGLVFLKNVPTEGRKLNPDSETETISVEEVAKIFGPIRETFYGKSWDVKIVPEAKNIAYTNLDLGLHMDLLYFEAPPGLQYLHSLKNSVKGGTSIFLDSFKAVEYLKQISPESYEILKSEYITFHYENDNHNYHYQKKIIDTSNPNEYLQVNYSPPFQGQIIFENNNKIEKFYKSLFEFEQILKMPGMIFKYRLNPGDLVIFHNRRVFHGRTSFDAVGGERHFKGTYTDWDDFKDLERRSNFEEQE
ncbi:hypothetical protein HDU92_007405 [Lobulomyces angularis]|nr:hypothetical protein HDU92_007405 [Lobulomyces angularis]